MRRSICALILIVALLLAGCEAKQGAIIITATPEPVTELPTAATAPTVQPTAIVFLNDNPNLELGKCNIVTFTTEAYGDEVIKQCIPEGYSLYENITLGNSIRILYQNVEYFILPNGSTGSSGITLPGMVLTPGEYTVKVYGTLNVWGEMQHYAFVARYEIEDMDGTVYMGATEIEANGGDYMAQFTLNAPTLARYLVSVSLDMTWPMTASSWVTIKTITVEAAN